MPRQPAKPNARRAFHITGDEPWLPIRGETAHDYYLFKVFLDLGATRSLVETDKITEKGISVIKAVASANRWKERAAQYDTHVMALEFSARDNEIVTNAQEWEKRRSSIRENAFNNANALINKALQMLQFPLEVEVESSETTIRDDKTIVTTNIVRAPAKWSLRDAATLLQVADQLQRLAADMNTSRVSHTVDENRLQVTVKLVSHLIQRGDDIDVIRRNLLGSGLASEDIESAIQKVLPTGSNGSAKNYSDAVDAEFVHQ